MNLFRRFATIALVAFSFVGVGSVNTAYSDPVTVLPYILTGGTLDGTLNGVPFSNASFTMTAEADPAGFNTTPNDYFSGGTLYSQSATTTMTLDGFSPFQILIPSIGPFFNDYGDGTGYGGFGYVIDADNFEFLGMLGAFSGDVMSGSASLVGTLAGSSLFTWSTTAGDLVLLGGIPGPTTFSSSPVPEIDPAGLGSVLALIGGGLGLLERRRKRV